MFELTSREGLSIRGAIDAPREARALAVIVHGFKGFKDWGFFPWVAESLCDEGIAVARFNMSRSGIGENPDTFDRLDLFAGDTYTTQIHDLMDVVHYVHAEFRGLPLFLLGHSRGGGIALLAAREIDDLVGVVTWSSIARADRWDKATKKKWRAEGTLQVENSRTKQLMPMSTAILDDYEKHASRLDILDSAARLSVPLLSVHGGRDESVPLVESREIAARAPDSSLLVIEAASHTYNAIHPLVHVPRELEYAAAVTAHFINAYA
ncbi:MAG TPA: alpha/beta fold hydrolase [Thermoanaerobaculia bacterium]|nr:alpha/beta fold hydrolase [Thermoanaerobaculia bacterium]